jgi:hypothetical protein
MSAHPIDTPLVAVIYHLYNVGQVGGTTPRLHSTRTGMITGREALRLVHQGRMEVFGVTWSLDSVDLKLPEPVMNVNLMPRHTATFTTIERSAGWKKLRSCP